MDVTTHIDAVRQEGQRFAAAASAADLDTPIEYCPGWTMRDLVRHLAEIHLWAAAHVGLRASKMWVDDLSELSGYWPDLAEFWPSDEYLVDHYIATNENLLAELERATSETPAMTFLPAAHPKAMWARRQAHEIAIHRFDAQHAANTVTGFDAALATDGVDEILTCFAPRASALPMDRTKHMGVRAIDTDTQWTVSMGPAGISTERAGGEHDVLLTGAADALYRVLWNRGARSEIEITGDHTVLDDWSANHRVRWD